MAKVAIILHLEIDPARVEEFLEVAKYDAEMTMTEPGDLASAELL